MEENVTQHSQFTENDVKIQKNGGLSGKRGSLSYCELGDVGNHVENYAHSKSSMQLSAVQNQNDNSNQLTTTNPLAMSVSTTSNSAIPPLKKYNFLTTYIHRVFDHCKVIRLIK